MRAVYRPLPTPDYLRREVERVAASVHAHGSAAAHIDAGWRGAPRERSRSQFVAKVLGFLSLVERRRSAKASPACEGQCGPEHRHAHSRQGLAPTH